MSRCSTCQVLVYFVASYLYEVVRLKSKNGFSFEDALETLQSEYVSHYEKACMCEPGTSPERLYVYFFDLWMPKTDELILFNPIQITMQVVSGAFYSLRLRTYNIYRNTTIPFKQSLADSGEEKLPFTMRQTSGRTSLSEGSHLPQPVGVRGE